MDSETQNTAETTTTCFEFAEPTPRKSLEILRDTEALLRRPTIGAITPILPAPLSRRLEEANTLADNTLNKLASIDVEEISDWELRPARIKVGLSFVGFSALMVVILLLYLNTLHSELSPVEQIARCWYQYIWFVNVGVTGMFILGREAMRPIKKPKKRKRIVYR
jgi:hypothetical protein